MADLNKPILIVDCQTSAMHPNNGFIIQLGWCLYNSESAYHPLIEKRLLQPPQSESIPPKIIKLLNIRKEELNQASCPQIIAQEFNNVIESLGDNAFMLIHYAQFELSFLKKYFLDYLNQSELNVTTLCTQKLTKRLFPNLPSFNLKALAGYFKLNVQPNNDVLSHVQTTLSLWDILKKELISKDLLNFAAVVEWMKEKALQKESFYHYNIERLTRLNFPANPGIYRMLSNEGRVLYIGKAKSLKSRINSYFRGFKNRDKRKLEMLAQVWLIETEICNTVLEAELLEADEIKQHNPPYNILLKNSSRELHFYDNHFTTVSTSPSELFVQGPFKPFNAIEILLELHQCLVLNRSFHFLDGVFSAEEVKASWDLFCQTHQLAFELINTALPRQLLALAYQLLNYFEKRYGQYQFEKWWTQQKKLQIVSEKSSIEILADKLFRLFIRAAETRRKSKQLVRLYQSKIKIVATQSDLHLTKTDFKTQPFKANQIDASMYDKLSILLTAKRKRTISTVLIA